MQLGDVERMIIRVDTAGRRVVGRQIGPAAEPF